jgi:hypothetical protein
MNNNLICWGNHRYGQSKVPDILNNNTKVVSVGGLHTCAISLNDDLYCFGYNG